MSTVTPITEATEIGAIMKRLNEMHSAGELYQLAGLAVVGEEDGANHMFTFVGGNATPFMVIGGLDSLKLSMQLENMGLCV